MMFLQPCLTIVSLPPSFSAPNFAHNARQTVKSQNLPKELPNIFSHHPCLYPKEIFKLLPMKTKKQIKVNLSTVLGIKREIWIKLSTLRRGIKVLDQGEETNSKKRATRMSTKKKEKKKIQQYVDRVTGQKCFLIGLSRKLFLIR